MHGFLTLAPVLALVLGQTEPVEPSAPAEPPPAEEPAAAPPSPSPVEPAPATAEARPARAAPPPARPDDRASASPARPAEPERAQVARSALAFLDALLAGDVGGLSAGSSERFSFDGDVRAGRDEVRRAWLDVMAARDPERRGALLDLEILPASDAVARLGAPPPRLAPLATMKGAWVAIANVSRRPLVLFLAREAGRFAVVGME